MSKGKMTLADVICASQIDGCQRFHFPVNQLESTISFLGCNWQFLSLQVRVLVLQKKHIPFKFNRFITIKPH